MTRFVSIRLPENLAEAVDAEAQRLDRTRTWVIVRALRSSLPAGVGEQNSQAFAAPSPAGVAEGMQRRRLKLGGGGEDDSTQPRA